jgi:hypothetical protein
MQVVEKSIVEDGLDFFFSLDVFFLLLPVVIISSNRSFYQSFQMSCSKNEPLHTKRMFTCVCFLWLMKQLQSDLLESCGPLIDRISRSSTGDRGPRTLRITWTCGV